MTRSLRGFAPLACALIASCSAHHGDLTVGKDGTRDASTPNAGRAGEDSTRAGRSGTSAVPAGGTGALAADIENREGVALDVVTVACAGECFEVVAVARGGYPPYSYPWEDGSTSAVRRLCPDASQAFEVKATDRGYESEEFKRASETVTAAVTAEVLACPDAGVPDAATPQPDAGADAGPNRGSTGNRSAFRTARSKMRAAANYGATARPPLSARASPSSTGDPDAPDGMYYVSLDPEPGRPVTISVPLCEPIKTGIGYYWTQAWKLAAGSGPVVLEFYYATTACGLDGKLSDLFRTPYGRASCSSWLALWDAQWLTIRAVATGNRGGTVFIDELLDISSMCPIPDGP